MEKTTRYWKNRYKVIKEIKISGSIPFNEKIEIRQFICEDLLLKQEVILKKIKINENEELKELARFLWHYEMSLNQKAINNSDGKTLLKLIDSQYDPIENYFIIVTDFGGISLKECLTQTEQTDDSISFQNFLSGKKRKWDSILKLVEGLSSLHNSGLIHRNISLETIYFNSNSYREGEKEVLKIGDFNWSIYLYSIANIFSNKFSIEIIQCKNDFFRAPECNTDIVLKNPVPRGENNQSDLFSLGLVLAFLLTDLDINKYKISENSDKIQILLEIRDYIKNYKRFLEQEREIILKLIEIEPEKRFLNAEKLKENIKNFLRELKYKFSYYKELPIYFPLSRQSRLLEIISNRMNIGIDAIIRDPDEFLRIEFSNTTFYLSKDQQFPLWVKGKTGTVYKIRSIYRRPKLAELFIVRWKEYDFEKTDIQICNTKNLFWRDKDSNDPIYLGWEKIFATSLDLINEKVAELSEGDKDKERWLETIEIVTDAEIDLEEKKIFDYQLISSEQEKKLEEEYKIKIAISNLADEELFSDPSGDFRGTSLELVLERNIFEPFKEKRKWKISSSEYDENIDTTVFTLVRTKKGEDPPLNGFIRMWELKNTAPLLRRKYGIIQNLEKHELLLNSILKPASTHKYFERDIIKKEIVTDIFNTFPIFLLQGPPGTGKTWTAKELIKVTLENDPYAKILVTSKEHFPLDDLLTKTLKMIQDLEIKPKPMLIRLISTEREQFYDPKSLIFLHFNKIIAKNLLEKLIKWVPKNPKLNELGKELNKIAREDFESPSREWIELVKQSSNILFCTTTARELQELEYFHPSFDLVIIEESGKAYPSELLFPLQLGNKWVLIGDQNQLPPFRVDDINEILEERLEKKENEVKGLPNYSSQDFLEFKQDVKKEMKIFQSMFDRFQKVNHSFNKADQIKSCDTLINQYRLPSKISRMISTIFYNKEFIQKIKDPELGSFIIEPEILKDEQLIWINTSYKKEYKEQRSGYDIYNIGEALLIKDLLTKIQISENNGNFSIAILTPYKEQLQTLIKTLPNQLNNLKNIKIRESCYTIDSFQGREADLVIISLVRNNRKESSRRAWGFIPGPERLNVMLSRARRTEIIVGNFDMCRTFHRDDYMTKFNKVAKFVKNYGKLLTPKEVLE